MGLRLPAITSLLVVSGGTWGFVGFPVGIFILLSCKLEPLLPVCQDWGAARVSFVHKDTNALPSWVNHYIGSELYDQDWVIHAQLYLRNILQWAQLCDWMDLMFRNSGMVL